MEAKIIRSKRKTLALSVTREGEVVLRVPYGVSSTYVSRFLQVHAGWIEAQLNKVAQSPKLDLSDGAELVLFGSAYRVGTGRARIADEKIYLPAEGREGALTRLLKKFVLQVMSQATARIAETYGFAYSAVRVSSARGRWGSCNRSGVIAYTFRVAFLPPELCEYVIVHELAHTVVFNHSAEFREVVGAILPDWKRRRKALKEHFAMNFL